MNNHSIDPPSDAAASFTRVLSGLVDAQALRPILALVRVRGADPCGIILDVSKEGHQPFLLYLDAQDYSELPLWSARMAAERPRALYFLWSQGSVAQPVRTTFFTQLFSRSQPELRVEERHHESDDPTTITTAGH